MKDLASGFRDYNIPDYMHGAIERYLYNHIPPGSFLTAVICNDLREACIRADDTNRHLIFNYVQLMYNCFPIGTWGNPESYERWLESAT